MALRIITDSGSDIQQFECKEKGIDSIPLSISFGDEAFLDGFDLSFDEFYRRLLLRDVTPITSQPAPGLFLEHFLKAKESGDEVLAILLSGGLSGTVQSAEIAREMADYAKIEIVDSLSAVTGQRMLVDTAIAMRDEGKGASEIAQALNQLKSRVKIVAAVDTLEYLYRGGRLSRAQTIIGNLVNLKPIIGLNEEGKVFVRDKCMGRAKAMNRILETLSAMPPDPEYPIYMVYSCVSANALELKKLLQPAYPEAVSDRHFYNVGPTIGTHAGDGAFGITYIAEKG